MIRIFSFIFIFQIAVIAQAQNTVGVITHDVSKTSPGYNLFYPYNQTNVYLLDNCGRIVKQWNDTTYTPGNSAYLMPNGDLWRTGRHGTSPNPMFAAGGASDVVQLKSWNDSLIWHFQYSDSVKRMHHDVAPLPNGNVLIVAWELKSAAQAIAQGRDTALLPSAALWPDHVVEVQRTGLTTGTVVWEWHAWDHMIQDFDSTKANYGVVSDYPELININHVNGNGASDWLHVNAIDYNPARDEIILSVPNFNELWIIDHSTTTVEAASHTGGAKGKGGDLLYRWGNPAAYKKGTSADQKFVFQHDTHWMDIGLPQAHPDSARIMVFNNRWNPGVSAVQIIDPPYDSLGGYALNANGVFGPSNNSWHYNTTPPSAMYSSGLAGAQRLPNGNTLVCSGRQGWTFEVDAAGIVVWEYINPFSSGTPVSQGTTLLPSSNLLFRMNRYPDTYPAFQNMTLTPGAYIELNPDTGMCLNTGMATAILNSRKSWLYPNPASHQLNINSADAIAHVELYNLFGNKLNAPVELVGDKIAQADVSALSPGYYLVKLAHKVGHTTVLRFVITR